MTIYYLYIKTHNITGLKYLGQTKKNPHYYLGSGVDWKTHLVKNGNNVRTEILFSSISKQELNNWGRHYSNLWKITTAVDDFGNKIWANRIPETGGGSGEIQRGKKRTEAQRKRIKEKTPVRYGEDHAGYDHKIYIWQHEKSGEIIKCSRQEFIKNFNASPGNVCDHINGDKRVVFGWQVVGGKNHRKCIKREQHGNKSSRYDHTIYCWKNEQTGEIIHSTRHDLIKKYNLHSGRICYVVSGKQKSHNGWSIIR